MQLPGRILSEIRRVVESASVQSRVAAGATVLLGAAVLCGLVMRSSTEHLVPVVDTADWNPDEVDAVQTRINRAGLPEAVLRDGQLLVPESAREQYRVAIGDHPDQPRTWAESWEEANATLSQFSLSAERDDVREITRAKLTSRLLNEFPHVELADVVWDEERRAGWNRPPLVRATVYLKPRSGHRITLQTVHAVRLAVAGSKAYLDPENVVVIDMSDMVAFDQAALGADFSTRYGRITRLSAEYRQRAEEAISHISGATIEVVVEPVQVSPALGTSGVHPPAQFEPETQSDSLYRTAFHQEPPNTGLEVPPILEPQPVSAESRSAASPDDTSVGSDDERTRYDVCISVFIPGSYYQRVAETRRLLPAASMNEANRILESVEQEVKSDVRSRLAGLSSQIDPETIRQTIAVESVAADPIGERRLVAMPVPTPSRASFAFLSGSRIGLFAVTVLMTCWLLWAVVRMWASRSRSGSSDAQSGPPPSSSVGGTPESPAQAVTSATETASATATDVAVERVTEILSADKDGIVHQEFRPEASQSGHRSHYSSRLPMPEVENWDIDSLAGLPDGQLRRLVRSVAIDTWPAALSAAAPATRRRLLSALPDGEAEQLREVLQQVRPIRLDDIDLAQREVQSALSND